MNLRTKSETFADVLNGSPLTDHPVSQVLGLIEEVDLSDPSQAQAARDAVGEMLKPPDDSLSPIPTRPPKKKPQQEESGSDENDVNEPNTDTGEEGKQELITS